MNKIVDILASNLFKIHYQLFRLFLQNCKLTFNLSKELILCRLA